MSVVGFQDFWIVGARVYFTRDAISGVNQPVIDLGLIKSAVPTITPEKIELKDPDGGTKTTVDEEVTEIDETWEIVTANMNKDNHALLFLGNAPEEFTQSAGSKSVAHEVFEGHLIKIHDDDTELTNLFALSAISGITKEAVSAGVLSTDTVTAASASAKTITTTTDLSLDGVGPGSVIILLVTGLANVLNSRTYTVASISTTTITVNETIAADESAISGTLIYKGTGDTGTIYTQDTDWEVVSKDRGLARVITGGAISGDNQNVVVHFGTAALSGKRLVKPQKAAGSIKGTAIVVLGRANNEAQDAREARVSITPSNYNPNADDYSDMTFSVKVLSDLSDADDPAGRWLQFKGSLPTVS